jgi:hypothetical protein
VLFGCVSYSDSTDVHDFAQNVLAVRTLGLGIASGIVGGCIILSSFAWGVSATGLWGDPVCKMASEGLAVLGLVVLVGSVAGLAWFGAPLLPVPAQPVKLSVQAMQPAVTVRVGDEEGNGVQPAAVSVAASALVGPDGTRSTLHRCVVAGDPLPSACTSSQSENLLLPPQPSRGRLVTGCVLTAMLGLVLGSVVVPVKLAAADGVDGLEYVAPFGVCVMGVTLGIGAGWCGYHKRWLTPHLRAAALPGCAAGVNWSIGEHIVTLTIN